MTVPERVDAVRESDSLSSAFVVFKRRWFLIALFAAAGLLVAVVHHARAAKSYSATASVAFQAATLPDAALQVSPGGSSEPQRTADTEVLIAHSSQVAESVRKELGSSASAKELLEEVKVEAAPNADILNIVATTGSPRESARLANAFAKQYIAFKASAQVATIEEAQRRLQEQIAALPAGSGARAALEQSQQRLGGLRAVTGGGANVISLAVPPTSPSGLSLTTTAIVGILIGFAIAFAVVFVLESIDRRVKVIEEFEREYRLPALTGVPQSALAPERASDRTSMLEPYRILRSSLDFAALARSLNTLLITSAVPNEGKTTVAIDLAHALALTGRKVTLVEFDLRRPTFARQLGLSSNGGLTSALMHKDALGGLLHVPFEQLPNLLVLPAGRLPPNPSELLGSERIDEILAELSRGETTIIVDAPPLNPVADAQVLLNHTSIDGVVIVARVDKTTREEVRRARAILDRHTVAPIGLVVTGLRDAGRYGYETYETDSEGPKLDPKVSSLSRPNGAATSRRATR